MNRLQPRIPTASALGVCQNIPHQTFVRWGVNGGGIQSYCLFRGKPCFFKTKREAQRVIQEYGIPEHYEIKAFKEIEVSK